MRSSVNFFATTLAMASGAFCYDAWQQVFGQALSAYKIHPYNGTQQYLQNLLVQYLPSNISQYGAWSVAYGPIVYKKNPQDTKTTADNVWFASYNKAVQFEDGNTYPTYVISVAGTQDDYDWLDEDFSVNSVVNIDQWATQGLFKMPDWTQNPANTGTNAYISNGTAFPVNTIATYIAPNGTLPLYKWLADVASYASTQNISTKFIFTGHSLGSPLSTALGLMMMKFGYLKQSPPVLDVRLYPLAGPSTGNLVYTNQIGSYFQPIIPASKPGAYATWNLNVANELDIVPMAWCNSQTTTCLQNRSLQHIKDVYSLCPLVKDTIDTSVDGAIGRAKASGLSYSVTNLTTFQSANPPPSAKLNTTELKYFISWQHGYGYCKQILNNTQPCDFFYPADFPTTPPTGNHCVL